MHDIVGRKKEIEELERLYNSPKAECVIMTGRRRVGKTFLIREVFNQRITFYHTGLPPYDEEGRENVGLREQLQQFFFSLKRFGHEGNKTPINWIEAFFMLSQLLEKIDNGQRQVVFIDELPWMDTKGSHFLQAFEGFVNGWAMGRRNMMLILCGSATSWVEDNFIHNNKGLYNRHTDIICLRPFTLSECEEYCDFMGLNMNRFDITEAYMALGGIPYYWGYLNPSLSLAQNIDQMFFAPDAKLRDEFMRLFGSLFRNPDKYIQIIRLLATRHSGFTREEIIQLCKIPSGSTLTNMLRSLEVSCFIKLYQPFGTGKNACRYKLTDNLCMFYLHFMEDGNRNDAAFWQHSQNLPAINNWRGLAFEEVCFLHIPQIKNALGVSNVLSEESAWNVLGTDTAKGAQMDLIISRNDNVVNVCEMKYISRMFTVDKDYDLKLRQRLGLVEQNIKRRQTIHTVLVTTFGLERNKYSSMISNVITLDDLFK